MTKMSLLEAENLRIWRSPRFEKGPFHLILQAGEAVAVIGPNGCGKTSLMLCLLGKLKSFSGRVRREFSASGQIGMASNLFPHWTVSEHRDYFSALLSRPLAETTTLKEFRRARVTELSRGQQRAVELDLLLGLNLPLYFFDEVFTFLDQDRRQHYSDLLEDKKNSGTCLMMSFHSASELPFAFDQELSL